MAIVHALLGLLAIQPRHGYDLKKEFTDESVLGDIVHVEAGMIYAHLKKLERNNWVVSSLEPQESHPPRRVFRLTDNGRDELDRWMSEPVGATRDVRLEFLLKLYMVRVIDPARFDALLDEQLGVCKQFIASLCDQIDEETDEFHSLILQMRLAQNQALVNWLERAAERAVSG